VYEVRDLWENALVDRGRFAAGSILYRAARTLETRLLRRASAVVTIGETLRNELQTRTRTDILIAPNGADVDAFRPTGPQAEWQQKWNPGGHRVLAYIGSFQPYEGLDVLIKAMRDIVARRHDVRLLVVGDGPEKAALTALAAAEGVTDFVKFTGRVPHNQVRELYAVADVLIYPRIDTLTTRLTTPLKPLEALSMEKAVLASDLSALRELVEPDVTGLLFAAGRSDELAKAALRLLDDDQLRKRLGMAGRDAVIRSKTWKASVSRYRPLYDSLLKRSNGR
jgi:glycosyltransferase involved in cell wall biosynthesis